MRNHLIFIQPRSTPQVGVQCYPFVGEASYGFYSLFNPVEPVGRGLTHKTKTPHTLYIGGTAPYREFVSSVRVILDSIQPRSIFFKGGLIEMVCAFTGRTYCGQSLYWFGRNSIQPRTTPYHLNHQGFNRSALGAVGAFS